LCGGSGVLVQGDVLDVVLGRVVIDLAEHHVPHVKVEPVDDVEEEKQEGSGQQEEPINARVLVEPSRVVLVQHRLAPLVLIGTASLEQLAVRRRRRSCRWRTASPTPAAAAAATDSC